MKHKTLIVVSGAVIMLAIVDASMDHWRAADIRFVVLISLQAILFVAYSVYEKRRNSRLARLPSAERERELAKLTPEQREQFDEEQNEHLR